MHGNQIHQLSNLPSRTVWHRGAMNDIEVVLWSDYSAVWERWRSFIAHTSDWLLDMVKQFLRQFCELDDVPFTA